MAVREGRWDCTTCGTVGNRGSHLICPNCGNPRPKGVRFYLPSDSEEVSADQAVKARAGADWLCEYCGSSNEVGAGICKQCGAEKGGAVSQKVQDYDLQNVPGEGDNAPRKRPSTEQAAVPPARRKRRFGCWIFPAIAILLIGYLGYRAFHRERVTAEVSGFAWHRAIQVEKYGPVVEEGWNLPGGARLLKQNREVHHTNNVLDHYETRTRQVSEKVQTGTRTYVCGQKDLGNGYFEDIHCTEPVYETRTRTETSREPVYRKEPVYQTKYTYEINKWTPARKLETNGIDQNPHWPDLKLSSTEREAKREQKYAVLFTDNHGGRYSLEFDESRWRAFQRGQKLPAEIHGLSKKELKLLPDRK